MGGSINYAIATCDGGVSRDPKLKSPLEWQPRGFGSWEVMPTTPPEDGCYHEAWRRFTKQYQNQEARYAKQEAENPDVPLGEVNFFARVDCARRDENNRQ